MRKTTGISKTALSAKHMIIPTVIIIILMHALIVLNTFRINNMGNVIAEETQRNFRLGAISNSFSQSTDAMGGTALSFVNSGEETELQGYFDQFGQTQGNYEAMQKLLEQQRQAEIQQTSRLMPHAQAAVGEGAEQSLRESMDAVMKRSDRERMALVLAAEARGVSLDSFPQLKSVELPEELRELPKEAKIARARDILTDPGYQSMRGDVQRNLSIAVGMSNGTTAASIQQYSRQLATFRMEQWALMGLIIITLLVMIVLLFTKLILPLEKSVQLVQQGQLLSSEHGFSELRRLAWSYDELLERRNELEEDLRQRSHTDALTGLQNRMAFQEYVNKLEKQPGDSSVTVFSMDVNCLKETNDKNGHLCGDILLREAASCVLKTFGDQTGKNVFRIGGDEFSAICLNTTEEETKRLLENFRNEQIRYSISISAGHAYAPKLKDVKVRQLFELADKRMYENKAASKLANNEAIKK
jgi:diguanylate cyclase (GGDEF)-like protein